MHRQITIDSSYHTILPIYNNHVVWDDGFGELCTCEWIRSWTKTYFRPIHYSVLVFNMGILFYYVAIE